MNNKQYHIEISEGVLPTPTQASDVTPLTREDIDKIRDDMAKERVRQKKLLDAAHLY